jgi:hypothetical protein
MLSPKNRMVCWELAAGASAAAAVGAAVVVAGVSEWQPAASKASSKALPDKYFMGERRKQAKV